MTAIASALQGWLRLPSGQFMRQYRFKDEEPARKLAFRAKECAIDSVRVDESDKGYWWVTLTHGVKPKQVQMEYISGKNK